MEVFREARDGGQDAVFLLPAHEGTAAIGSVQCKHSSDGTRALRAGDLTPEIENVQDLIEAGQADTYVLMTNMSVDAPVAFEIRKKLNALGVRKAHVLGKQYLTRAIRSSPRLRALVPQVYGLGDVSAILDERLSQQSRALLDHWIPKLRKYVPTRPHRRAVTALNEHSVVLLLGNASSGKSAIGAILSTIASENPNHTVLNLTSPRDFEAGWNPNDPGRFFWIDDAFGPNVLREDYVQDWASAFRKVLAAISHGNKFLLTSRMHIYEAAKRRLGQRNLPMFLDGSAIVNVGALTQAEKEQILYNHINFGGQSQSWRTSVKPHLEAVARVPDFLPGIAERLGDPAFTKSLAPRENALVRFMQEPREHLIDTVNALDEVLQAALVLVYVHQGAFDESTANGPAAIAVAELTGFPLPRILDCFAELRGSFLKGATPGAPQIWSFAHPTIADALTEILREKPHMMAALLRGATIDTILSGFVCEGAASVRDALMIPTSLNEPLVARLLGTPSEADRNWSLLWFLAIRASDAVFQSVVTAAPTLLSRTSWSTHRIGNDPRILAHARAHRMGLLDPTLREESATKLEQAVQVNFDLSFFDDPDVLALVPAKRLVSLGMRLRAEMLPNARERIEELSEEADLDEEPESHFEFVLGALTTLEGLAIEDDEASELIDAARSKISSEIRSLNVRKEERDSEKEDDVDWSQIASLSRKADAEDIAPDGAGARSVFDDVDQ